MFCEVFFISHLRDRGTADVVVAAGLEHCLPLCVNLPSAMRPLTAAGCSIVYPMGADAAHCGQVHVVVNGAAPRVESGDGLHLAVGQGYAEAGKVFGHTRAADRLGDDDYAPLVEPSQHDGSHSAAVAAGNGSEHRVVEDARLPFGERSPGLVLRCPRQPESRGRPAAGKTDGFQSG